MQRAVQRKIAAMVETYGIVAGAEAEALGMPRVPYRGDLVTPAFLRAPSTLAAQVVALLRHAGWPDDDIVLWLVSPNGYLADNAPPADVLDDPAVLEAADHAAHPSW